MCGQIYSKTQNSHNIKTSYCIVTLWNRYVVIGIHIALTGSNI